jgi:glycosyltransferase involved in cell wall biosynthesis
MQEKSISLIIESNNLMGGKYASQYEFYKAYSKSLIELLKFLKKQTFSLSYLDKIVLTHPGLPIEFQNEIIKVSEVDLSFISIPQNTGYYEAKNIGFLNTTSEIVVFCDSDCRPVDVWLQELVNPILKLEAKVTAGRTHYAPNILGISGTTIDFMYFLNPKKSNNTLNFYANNIAFKRDVFEHYLYQMTEGIYRGNCQIFGLKMQKDQIQVQFVNKAKTCHAFPDTFLEFAYLRFHRGQDLTELSPHLIKHHVDNKFIVRLINWKPLSPLIILIIRFYFSIKSINKQDMPKLKLMMWPVCILLITFVSFLDFIGAMSRAIGLSVVGHKFKNSAADSQSLSYHKA